MHNSRSHLTLLLLLLLIASTSPCHYSCLECTSNSYAACTSCPNNQPFSYRNRSNQGHQTGICAAIVSKSPNILGILLVGLTIASCLTFGGQKVFYFALILQTLGLLFLFDSYWIAPLDYVLESFSYFMTISYIMYPIKAASSTFKSGISYKAMLFIKNGDLWTNLIILGPLQLLIFLAMIFLPVYKYFRKAKPHRSVPDWKLQKAIVILSTIYFFLIQQTLTIIFITLSKGQKASTLAILMTIFYLLSLLLYFFNQCKFPLPFFRHRYSQLLIFTSKVLGPLFLSVDNHLLWIYFVCILPMIFFEAISTNENKDRGKINRLFLFKFGTLLTFSGILLNYIVESTVDEQITAQVFGYIGLAAVIMFLCMYLLQLILQFRENICMDKDRVDAVITQSNVDMLADNDIDKKVYPMDLPVPSDARKKHPAKKIINESVNLDQKMISLDLESLGVEPSLVFNDPEEEWPAESKNEKVQPRIQVTIHAAEQQQYFIPPVNTSTASQHFESSTSGKLSQVSQKIHLAIQN